MKKIFVAAFYLFSVINSYAQEKDAAGPYKIGAVSLMDSHLPLVAEHEGGYVEKLAYYSYFLKHLEVEGGLVSYNRDSATGKRIGVRIVNLPLLNIIENAYGDEEIGPFQVNRIMVETKGDMKDLLPPETMNVNDQEYRKWRVNHTWCYDLRIPVSQSDHLSKIMQQDIERYFNLRGAYEQRKVRCLVLARIGGPDRLRTSDSGQAPSVEMNKELLVIKNGNIEDFVRAFKRVNNTYLPPIIDETGYTGKIDLKLFLPLDDLNKVRSELSKYGLVLREEERQLKMLVIRETARL